MGNFLHCITRRNIRRTNKRNKKMTEQQKYRLAKKVGPLSFRKQNVIYELSKESYPYAHEMWFLYMGLVESYCFRRS